METFLNFLVNYWQYISIGLVVLLELILMIIKRKKVSVLPEGLLNFILTSICEAEVKFGSGRGSDKFTYVLTQVSQTYPTVSSDAVKAIVDFVLTSPTKKGGLGREQIEQKSK